MKMNQKLYNMTLVSISIILVFLVVCNAHNENRGLAAAAPRKPPFNGSIYGKRSSWPFSYAGPEMHGTANAEDEYYQADLRIGELASLIKQREALIKASVNECLALQQASESDSDQPVSALCAKLLGTRSAEPQRNLDGEKWFGQLISSGRSVK